MKTFGYGDRVVNANSIEEGLAIIRELERLDAEVRQEEEYTHVWGHDWRCILCGRSDIEIHFNKLLCRPEDRIR